VWLKIDWPLSPTHPRTTGGNIPDPMTVLAAKKKRQMLRETAAARASSDSDDFIPLSGGKARLALRGQEQQRPSR